MISWAKKLLKTPDGNRCGCDCSSSANNTISKELGLEASKNQTESSDACKNITYNCLICEKEFKSLSLRERHLIREHNIHNMYDISSFEANYQKELAFLKERGIGTDTESNVPSGMFVTFSNSHSNQIQMSQKSEENAYFSMENQNLHKTEDSFSSNINLSRTEKNFHSTYVMKKHSRTNNNENLSDTFQSLSGSVDKQFISVSNNTGKNHLEDSFSLYKDNKARKDEEEVIKDGTSTSVVNKLSPDEKFRSAIFVELQPRRNLCPDSTVSFESFAASAKRHSSILEDNLKLNDNVTQTDNADNTSEANSNSSSPDEKFHSAIFMNLTSRTNDSEDSGVCFESFRESDDKTQILTPVESQKEKKKSPPLPVKEDLPVKIINKDLSTPKPPRDSIRNVPPKITMLDDNLKKIAEKKTPLKRTPLRKKSVCKYNDPGSSEALYLCDICYEGFARRDGLTKHRQTHKKTPKPKKSPCK